MPPIGLLPLNRLSYERLDALLERIRGVRVLVIGDLMLDVYLRGNVSRISPEAPVPVVHVTEEWRALGGAANVAANVVALGAACELVGCIGDDDRGRDLEAEVLRLGIGARGLCLAPDRPTTVKTRIMARHQQVARFDHERDDNVPDELAEQLVATVGEFAADVDAIVLQDYDKGVLVEPVIAAAIEAGRRREIPVVVDPKSRNFFGYEGATVFKPNRLELEAALREPVQAEDPEWLDRTRRELGCEHLLVTLGEDGAALVTAEGDYVRVPTVARSVYDVSGAGDTVIATLAAALGAGADVIEAAILANHAAGIEVGKAGVATVSPQELRETIRLYQSS